MIFTMLYIAILTSIYVVHKVIHNTQQKKIGVFAFVWLESTDNNQNILFKCDVWQNKTDQW